MTEALVKKLFNYEVAIEDILEIEKYIAPLHQGFVMAHGMTGVPFFLSEPIGMDYDKKIGLFLTQNSIASYVCKLYGKIDLDVKYFGDANKGMIIHMGGSMNVLPKMFDGTIRFRKGQDDHYGFYILPSYDEKMFYKFLKNNLHR